MYLGSYTLQLRKSAAPFTWIYMYDSCLDPDPGHSIFSCTARMVEHCHLALSATPPYSYVARGSYWGHVMPGLGTPKVKIQVIDLEHLIDSRRAQIQWGPSPLHARAPNAYQVF